MSSLVVVDTQLTDYTTLLSDLPGDAEVLLLDAHLDGVSQLAAFLHGKTGYDALHLLAHGSSGALQLGNATLDLESMEAHAVPLRQIGDALTQDGDLLVYGCEVGQGEAGQQFIEALARLTGADVAASTDRTGPSLQGGDWQLEAVLGNVDTPSLEPTSYAGVLATFTGTSGKDVVVGNNQGDKLTGQDGNDTLHGWGGKDTLDGGLGADMLRGGTGADVYIVDDADDWVDEGPYPDPIPLSSNANWSLGSGHSYDASVSADGRYVAFFSGSSNLVPGDNNYKDDVFVKDVYTGAIQCVSTSSTGGFGNWGGLQPFISADGQKVVFSSQSSNLVAGDTNIYQDIFIKDLATGDIQRVSTTSSNGQSNGSSANASISHDGRYALFSSNASNLVAGDANSASDIFVKDLTTGAVSLVSSSSSGVQGNKSSVTASFSKDGNLVVFESYASNLAPGTAPTSLYDIDIFVKNLSTGELKRVSTDDAGNDGSSLSRNASISPDGRYVVFESNATYLVADDTNGVQDIFVKDLLTGAIQRVSTDSAGEEANASSAKASFSGDGRYVVFESGASNLVPEDDASGDVFVKDLVSGAVKRLSLNILGESAGGTMASLSEDGRYVVFSSATSSLVAGDTNGVLDVFLSAIPLPDDGAIDTVQSSVDFQLPDLVENLTLTGSSAIHGTGNTLNNKITGNAKNNVLIGGAGNDTLDGGKGADILRGGLGNDLYVVDNPGDVVNEMPSADTLRVSTNSSNVQKWSTSVNASFSPDGRYVIYEEGGDAGIWIKDLETGTSERVATGQSAYFAPSGTFIIFNGSPLQAGQGTGGSQVVGKDLETGQFYVLSSDAQGDVGNGNSAGGFLSSDGRYLAFSSDASNLVAGDNNHAGDVFVKDLQTGAVQLISTTAAGVQGNHDSYGAVFYPGGGYVIFTSYASNLVAGDTNGDSDVFLKDLESGDITLASGSYAGLLANAQANGESHSTSESFSADGRYVVFKSWENNLVAGDTNNTVDIFVLDLLELAIERVSTDASGGEANDGSVNASISTDGRYVVFLSSASNLVPGDTNNTYDIFVKDRVTGAIERVSTDAAGNEANGYSDNPRFSADGRFILFDSTATNLVRGDTNALKDVFRVANPLLEDGGTDTVKSSVDFTLPDYVEHLILTGTAAIDSTGNALANSITGNGQANSLLGKGGNDKLVGNAGNDTLDGGPGNDTLLGGLGTDTVSYATTTSSNATGVTVNLGNATTAQNTVKAGLDLIKEVENIVGSKFNDTLTGNGLGNKLEGGAGADKLIGNEGADKLYGQDGNDTLTGGAGNDLIVGGKGKDVMTGGPGNDVFDFNAINETLASTNRDVINDFSAGDKIDLSTLDANLAVAGNQAFTLTTGASFPGTFAGAGKLYYDTSTGILWGNNDADVQADFSVLIRLSGGLTTLAMSNIVL